MELVTPGLGLIVWTALIFLTLLFVLTKFAWGPISQALTERENFITEALASAEKAKAEMAQLKSDNEKLLQDARLERDRILKEANQVAAQVMSDAKDKSAVEAAKLVENARLQIQNEKNAVLTDLKNMVAQYSIEIAELIVKKELKSETEHKKLVQEYLKESKLN